MAPDRSWTRESAVNLVLCEAMGQEGLGLMIGVCLGDPGTERVERVIEALEFLSEEMAEDDVLSRDLVSAVFFLGAEVAGSLGGEQGPELFVAASAFIESWRNWPDATSYEFETPPSPVAEVVIRQLAGYETGDITYCQIPGSDECFPVRVAELTRQYLVTEPLREASASFAFESELNRRFYLPYNSPVARFGGEDERLVNAARKFGPELRLLPTHYATMIGDTIRQRHATDPERWPLPTGEVYERWFKES